MATNIMEALATPDLLTAILPKPDKHGQRLAIFLAAQALTAYTGIFITRRNQLQPGCNATIPEQGKENTKCSPWTYSKS